MSESGLLNIGSLSLDLNIVLLSTVVAIAAWFDIKSRRIPNWLVLAGMISSLGIQMLFGSGSFTLWCFGLLAGFGLFFPLYLVRAMGAGDVKLMAVVGAFVGHESVLSVVLMTLVAGGILAISAALWNGALGTTIANVRFMLMHAMVKARNGEGSRIDALPSSTGNLPYAVAIAAGTFIHLILERSGYALFT